MIKCPNCGAPLSIWAAIERESYKTQMHQISGQLAEIYENLAPVPASGKRLEPFKVPKGDKTDELAKILRLASSKGISREDLLRELTAKE